MGDAEMPMGLARHFVLASSRTSPKPSSSRSSSDCHGCHGYRHLHHPNQKTKSTGEESQKEEKGKRGKGLTEVPTRATLIVVPSKQALLRHMARRPRCRLSEVRGCCRLHCTLALCGSFHGRAAWTARASTASAASAASGAQEFFSDFRVPSGGCKSQR